jgi:hypothetical protein
MKNENGRGQLAPTHGRHYHDAGHRPPMIGLVDHDGRVWNGTSTWAALKADRRRAFMASKSAAA